MSQFTTETEYTTRSICDHDCIFRMQVISRTAKTIKAKIQGQIKTLRITVRDGVEEVKPLGSYSMCPVIKAA
jgi:uncharacterized protein YabE (DUF348 family)